MSVGEKMLNGRDADNALLDNIAKKGNNSYYYAHAPKDFTTEGAQHFKEDGKIYGGNPTLLKTTNMEEAEARRKREDAAKIKRKNISKHSWSDEDAKVKIYIDNSQFAGPIVESMVSVKFEEYRCEVSVTDAEGTIHVLSLFK